MEDVSLNLHTHLAATGLRPGEHRTNSPWLNEQTCRSSMLATAVGAMTAAFGAAITIIAYGPRLWKAKTTRFVNRCARNERKEHHLNRKP